MKSLLVSVFFATLLTATLSLRAQSQDTQMPLHSQAPETVGLVNRVGEVLTVTPSLNVSVRYTRIDISNNTDTTFDGKITNISTNSTYIYFQRTQSLPAGWSSSICFGTACYANTVDSMGETFAAGGNEDLLVHAVPTLGEVPDSGTIYLKLVGASGNPNDTVLLTFKVYYHPGNPPIIFKMDDSHVHWSVLAKGQHTFSPVLSNLSGKATMYHVEMQPTHLPTGWTAAMCIVDSCPGSMDAWQMLGPALSDNYSPKVKFTLNTPALPEKDSAVFYVRVHPQTAVAADSAIYRYAAILNDMYFATSGHPVFAGQGEHSDTATFHNYATKPGVYHFSMQSVMPQGWTSRLCVGDTCSNGTDISRTVGVDPDGSAQDSVIFTVSSLAVSQRDSAVLFLHVFKESNPSDSANYRVVEYVDPSAGVVGETPIERAGIAVTNAWPNPLIASARLNLEVATDKPGHAIALVYDMAGAQLSELDLGELSLGVNHLVLGNLNVPSGDYVIRINQGGFASEPIRVNCLK